MADKKYRVKAPYVTLKTMTSQGPAILGFHEGAIVPDDVSGASIQHHLDRDLIEEVPAKAMPVAAPQSDATGVPPAKGGPVDDDKGDPHAGESGEQGAGENPAAPVTQRPPAPRAGTTAPKGKAG